MLRSGLLRPGLLGMIEPALRGAWRELDAKLRPFIARRLRAAADVDDVAQDVLLRLQRGVGSLRDHERFGPWAYQVARSAIADHQRRAARHPLVDGSQGEEQAAGLERDDETAAELASCLAPFVAMLQSPYREALTLTELEGLSQKDAATMLGLSVSGMKSRVQRGRRQLREALEQCCHIALDARGQVQFFEPRVDGKRPEGCCSLQGLQPAPRDGAPP